MFIVIDGIDGAGKSTQLELLKNRLEWSGKTVKIVSYPRYGDKSCFYVEKYLNGWYGKDVSAKQASLFYALDRFDSVWQLNRDIEQYDYVLSDRYVSANMIHQWWKIHNSKERQEFLEWIYDLEYNILGLPKPDITLFLDISVQNSQKLMSKRADKDYIKSSNQKDIHEGDLEHLQNAKNVVSQVVSMQENFMKIDCDEGGVLLTREEVLEKIVKML